MQNLLIKIVLVSAGVLALFVAALYYYLDATSGLSPQSKTTLPATKSSDNATGNSTTAAAIQAVLQPERNQTLEHAYSSVASEIEDFIHTDRHQSVEPPEKVVPACPVKIETIPEANVTAPIVKHREVKKHLRRSTTKGLPKVVIIMDDIRSLEQGRAIKRLPMQVTPSIFPVTSDHPDTQAVAKMFACYMIHTPMEAFNYPNEEENTLRADDTLERIDARIGAIKRDFPNLTAINNHTGSKFTASSQAMDRLFTVLDKYGIPFVDSRTCAATTACDIARLHGDNILSRNIFLDNDDDVGAILAQLRETVRYAKRHGVAISICHPRPTTFRALKQARKILKGVKVVTLDRLYR